MDEILVDKIMVEEQMEKYVLGRQHGKSLN